MGQLIKSAAEGMVTGLFLQLAVGPVFFYILGITMDSNYFNSLCAVMAVTLADYIFIILSLLGIGKILQDNRAKKSFGLVSALILILFGLMFFYKGLVDFRPDGLAAPVDWTPLKSFTGCFVLTISSPLTILFWGSIFSAKAVEKNYAPNQLFLFGIGAGAATFAFLSGTMLAFSLFRAHIPFVIVQVLNCIVGLLLVYYGAAKLVTPLAGRLRKTK